MEQSELPADFVFYLGQGQVDLPSQRLLSQKEKSLFLKKNVNHWLYKIFPQIINAGFWVFVMRQALPTCIISLNFLLRYFILFYPVILSNFHTYERN